MQRLNLPAAMTTSALGFGTAQLMARIGRRESVRLLHAAFDAGITHIDTARLYGYGAAESAVGDLLEGRRHQITVATKFGIFPPARSPMLQTAKAVARAVARLNPRWRERMRARAGRLVTAGRFSIADATRSLDTSLKELRTDYVDMLLLHECRIADLEGADDLQAFLERAVAQGRVRAWGVATDVETVEAAAARVPAFTRVAFFPSDARSRHVARVDAGGRTLLTHSPFGRLLPLVRDHFERDPGAARMWSETLGENCGSAAVLSRLLLAAARAANPSGVVVFASTDAARIRANAAVVSGAPARPDTLAALTGLLQAIPDAP
jgi:D-threo-aldose 1-dehydrogenase